VNSLRYGGEDEILCVSPIAADAYRTLLFEETEPEENNEGVVHTRNLHRLAGDRTEHGAGFSAAQVV
jgi:hypothetical protein